MYEFIRGRRHSLDHRSRRARGLTIAAFCEDKPYTLDEIKWDPTTLQWGMQTMLRCAAALSTDLIRMWDHNNDRALDKIEFVAHLRALFHGFEVLWETEVMAVAAEVFEMIAGRADFGGHAYGQKIDVVELEAWLSTELDTTGLPRLKKGKELLQLQQRQMQQRRAALVSPQDHKRHEQVTGWFMSAAARPAMAHRPWSAAARARKAADAEISRQKRHADWQRNCARMNQMLCHQRQEHIHMLSQQRQSTKAEERAWQQLNRAQSRLKATSSSLRELDRARRLGSLGRPGSAALHFP